MDSDEASRLIHEPGTDFRDLGDIRGVCRGQQEADVAWGRKVARQAHRGLVLMGSRVDGINDRGYPPKYGEEDKNDAMKDEQDGVGHVATRHGVGCEMKRSKVLSHV